METGWQFMDSLCFPLRAGPAGAAAQVGRKYSWFVHVSFLMRA
jgi:hypothetical protein